VTRLEAGWIWHEGRLRRGLALELDEVGRLEGVVEVSGPPPAGRGDLALFPGFVNAHSHAFQWGLRGRVQRPAPLDGGGEAGAEPGAGAPTDFFSWRDHMFALADTLTPDSLFELSRRAFTTMRAAGYTAVGEFHYVHHAPDGHPCDPPTELAEVVVAAARTVGLRICLLHAAYLRPSGVASRVASGQRRFLDPDVETFLARHRALEGVVERMGDPSVTVGAAPHSVRTVPADALAELARRTSGPLHLHLNEQRRELAEVEAEHGLRPLDVVERAGALLPRTTLVHMTHASEAEVARTASAGAGICFCPTTERDLGDGIGPGLAACQLGVALSIGSDSQVQVDPLEELRLLEGNERLRREARLVLPPHAGSSLAATLLDVGSAGGAAALQLPTGRFARGLWADVVAIDLADPDLAGLDPELVPDALVFGASPRALRASWVGGRREPGAPVGRFEA
jgi:formimidoylglutamate deiminase